MTCGKCGAERLARARFCHGCGQPYPTTAPSGRGASTTRASPPSGERPTVPTGLRGSLGGVAAPAPPPEAPAASWAPASPSAPVPPSAWAPTSPPAAPSTPVAPSARAPALAPAAADPAPGDDSTPTPPATSRPIGIGGPTTVVGLVAAVAALSYFDSALGGYWRGALSVVGLAVGLVVALVGTLVAGLWLRCGATATAATVGLLSAPWLALALAEPLGNALSGRRWLALPVTVGLMWVASTAVALVLRCPTPVLWAAVAVAVATFGIAWFLGELSSYPIVGLSVGSVTLTAGIWSAAERRRKAATPTAPVAVALDHGAPGAVVVPSTNGFAIAALVLGILGFSVLSIVFGAIALSQISSSRGMQRGRGMAITGIVLGILWTAAVIALYVVLYSATQAY